MKLQDEKGKIKSKKKGYKEIQEKNMSYIKRRKIKNKRKISMSWMEKWDRKKKKMERDEKKEQGEMKCLEQKEEKGE